MAASAPMSASSLAASSPATLATAASGPGDALAAVVDPNDPIVKVIAALERGGLGVVAAADQVMNALEAAGMVKHMTIHPSQVGIDPSNRAGEGVNAMEVGLLASEIAAMGWSWAETAHATCIEVAPGSKDVEEFNDRLVRGSDGLAPVDEGSIKFGSLSCGHTNFGLRAIGAAAKSECPHLSRAGRYSVEHLASSQPEYAKAVREGLKWKVISWRARFLYPAVLDLIQRARNANSSVLRRENEMSGLLQLHNLSASSQGAVNWASVKGVVMRTNPPFAEKLDAMVGFVIARSGGQQGIYLRQLAAFFRNFVNPSKRPGLPAPVYVALAEFPHHFVALSLLKTCWTCPLKFAEGRASCEWISATEIQSLAKSPEPMVQKRLRAAESCLRDARALLPAAGVKPQEHEDNKLCTILTKLDSSMGRFLLGRQEQNKVAFAAVGDVAAAFVADLRAVFPHASLDVFEQKKFGAGDEPVASGVAKKDAGKSASLPAASQPDLSLYELDASGEAVSPWAVLRKAGFDVGARVTLRTDEGLHDCEADGNASGDGSSGGAAAASGQHPDVKPQAVWKLLGVVGADVELQSCNDSKRARMEVRAFVAAASAFTDGEIVQIHPAWPRSPTWKSNAALDAINKGHVLFALSILADLVEDSSHTNVVIQEKPSRQVVALNAIPPYGLVLVPGTASVRSLGAPAFAAAAGMKPFGPVKVELPGSPLASVSYVLEPRYAKDDACPFWFVQATADKAEANLIWSPHRVQLLGGVDSARPRAKPAARPRRRIDRKVNASGKEGVAGAAANEAAASGPDDGAAASSKDADSVELALEAEGVSEKLCVVPLLTNPKALAAGDVLRVWWEAPQPVRKAKVITVQQVQKKARLA